jgi:D-serine deaminase-like pyridoxal phosphate-dependent protein
MTRLDDISTPALVLDRNRLGENCRFMAARARELGVELRPHLKTAKSADVAKLATKGFRGGITVSTLTEAEYFAAHGFRDITLAVGFVPERLDRAKALLSAGVALDVITDLPTVAAVLAEVRGLGVLAEVDCGDRRGGVGPEADALLEIARNAGANFRGVLTHGGHSYRSADVQAIQQAAEDERRAVNTAAERLAAAGLACPVRSVGSTPTCTHARSYDGATEMRPGVYMFGDLDQVGLGSMPLGRVALSVLTTVIGVYPEQQKVIVDAGGLALSKDQSAQRHGPEYGYGLVYDMAGQRVEGARVFACSQEHGQITGGDLRGISVGTRLRIVPNHACMTAAAYDRYYVVGGAAKGGVEAEAEWARVNGWQPTDGHVS